MRALLLLACVLLLGACTRATIDEAYGVPDALEWSYFAAEPARVAEAMRDVLPSFGYTVESIGDLNDGGVVLSVTTSPPSAEVAEIRVQPTQEQSYRARAQVLPAGRPLDRSIEQAIRTRL